MFSSHLGIALYECYEHFHLIGHSSRDQGLVSQNIDNRKYLLLTKSFAIEFVLQLISHSMSNRVRVTFDQLNICMEKYETRRDLLQSQARLEC